MATIPLDPNILYYRDSAPLYQQQGWKPIPLPYKAKKFPPAGATGGSGTVTPEKITEWRNPPSEHGKQDWSQGNTALRVEGVLGVDVDEYGDKHGYVQLLDIEAEVGEDLPKTFYSSSRGPGLAGIRFFRVPEDTHFVGQAATDIELVYKSYRYAVVWPSIHKDSGNQYQWYGPDDQPTGIPNVEDLPELPAAFLAAWKDGSSRTRSMSTDGIDASAVDLSEWSKRLTPGDPSDMVLRKVRDYQSGRFSATTGALWDLAEIVTYYPEEPGTKQIFDAIIEARMTSSSAETPEHQRISDIQRSLRSAIAKHQSALQEAGEESMNWAKSQHLDAKQTGSDSPKMEDSPLAEWIAVRLKDILCWSSGMGWMEYDGRSWKEIADPDSVEIVRQELKSLFEAELKHTDDAARIKKATDLLRSAKIRAVHGLVKGILSRNIAEFDQHHDLLNCGNGVVDMRTKELLPHDSSYLFTKITPTEYHPEAYSADWDQALQAFAPGVGPYMQARFGQAATGHMTQDDVVPIMHGGGSNGKSTIVNCVHEALGGFSTMVSEKILLSNPNEHSTELTTLQGARLAIIEETPESRFLNVKRLKDVAGSPFMTARKIRQDNITWPATHSLMLTTNYIPQVSETDHGTWRRLALVGFPYTYQVNSANVKRPTDRLGDPGLRDRLKAGRHGEHEAILAWVVQGAYLWYQHDRTLPPLPYSVQQDTLAWRGESDFIISYTRDRIEFDPTFNVLSTELFEDFNRWLVAHGHQKWGEQLFSSRFAGHSVTMDAGYVKKVRTRSPGNLSRVAGTSWAAAAPPVPSQPMIWTGIKFRD